MSHASDPFASPTDGTPLVTRKLLNSLPGNTLNDVNIMMNALSRSLGGTLGDIGYIAPSDLFPADKLIAGQLKPELLVVANRVKTIVRKAVRIKTGMAAEGALTTDELLSAIQEAKTLFTPERAETIPPEAERHLLAIDTFASATEVAKGWRTVAAPKPEHRPTNGRKPRINYDSPQR